ncbi:MAG: hypothetical protein OEV40_12210 [Acidimicrobiia bacterium]|nr:hypothetical protein [Acidimicrobiia bacterium]
MRLFAIVAAGLAALAIWRRKEVVTRARRASQSAGELASSARAKIGRSGDEAEREAGEPVEASSEAPNAPGDETAATGDETAAAATGDGPAAGAAVAEADSDQPSV